MSRFEWDPLKDVRNRRKHGVAFETAATVLDDPQALMGYDRSVDGEDRWRMIGRVADGRVMVVAFVVRHRGDEEIVRIVSARLALRHERHRYVEQTY
jgi:uncharacterized DUF497 family protein